MKAKKSEFMSKLKVGNSELTRFAYLQFEPAGAVSIRSRDSKRRRLRRALVRYLLHGKVHIWKLGN